MWFKLIFTDAVGLMSSKRVCGVLGFIVCAGILIYCTILAIQAPEMIDTFIVSCMSLLGIDSFTNIFNRRKDE